MFRISIFLKDIITFLLVIYAIVAVIVCTLVILWGMMFLHYNATSPAERPIALPNGHYFSITSDVKAHITDQNDKEVITKGFTSLKYFLIMCTLIE